MIAQLPPMGWNTKMWGKLKFSPHLFYVKVFAEGSEEGLFSKSPSPAFSF